MAADAELLGAAANAGLGALLLFLAVLIRRSSPERAARGPLALFMALIGLNYFLDHLQKLLRPAIGPTPELQHLALLAVLLDPPVLLYFVLRLTGKRASPAMALATAGPGLALAALYVVSPPPAPFFDRWTFGALQPIELGLYYTLAYALLVRAYLAESRPLARDRMASFVLALGVVVLPRLPLFVVDLGAPIRASVPSLLAGLAVVVVLTALLVLPFVRSQNRRHVHRTARQLVALLVLVAGTWMLLLLPGLERTAESLVYSVRWFLFALILGEGIERYDLLNLPRAWEHRARLALYATFTLLAVAQVSALLADIPDTNLTTSLIGGSATVAIGAVVYTAINRPNRERQPELSWRRTAVYRAYVELGAEESELERVRERLRITPDEDRDIRVLVELERSLPQDAQATELTEGGVLFGRYEVQGFLGVGSFGRTFVAWDAVREERVVLKEVRPNWAGDDEALRHVRRDAQTMMALDHPNVVGFRSLERYGDGYLLVIEYIEGEDLRNHLQRGALPPGAVRTIAADLLAALEALHERGIVHRDVKPENVILRPDGRAVLLDFGTARRAEVPRSGTKRAGDATATGTPAYMAPEQVRRGSVGPAADLYACGAVLWELLVGRPLGHGEPLAPWAEVLHKATEEDPDQRFADAAAFRAALP